MKPQAPCHLVNVLTIRMEPEAYEVERVRGNRGHRATVVRVVLCGEPRFGGRSTASGRGRSRVEACPRVPLLMPQESESADGRGGRRSAPKRRHSALPRVPGEIRRVRRTESTRR